MKGVWSILVMKKIILSILSLILIISFTFSYNRLIFASEEYVLVDEWGAEGYGDGEFKRPWDITVDKLDNVYVSDHDNHRMQKFTSDGEFITEWYLTGVFGIAADDYGYVYATGPLTQVSKFDSAGNLITSWDITTPFILALVYDIAIDKSNNVYVLIDSVDQDTSLIQKFTSEGNFVTEWTVDICGVNGSFDVCSLEYIYVTDPLNHRILQFESNGTLHRMWGSMGTGDGEFLSPSGITVDELGYVYVKDSGEISEYFITLSRIQKFTSDGKFITKWSYSGIPVGGKMAIDRDGYVYVTQPVNNRILKFGKTGGATTTISTPSTTTSSTILTTTTATDKTKCPLMLIYGKHSEEAEFLRYFRDAILKQTPEGEELIKLYYEWNPAIVKAIEADEEVREQVKEMIDGVLSFIE